MMQLGKMFFTSKLPSLIPSLRTSFFSKKEVKLLTCGFEFDLILIVILVFWDLILNLFPKSSHISLIKSFLLYYQIKALHPLPNS